MELEEIDVATKLDRWKTNELERLIAAFNPDSKILESDINLKKKDYIHHLMEEEEEKLKQYFEKREEIKDKGVRINRAKSVLNDRYDVDNEKLDKASSGAIILLIIYEEGLENKLEIIAELSSVSGKSSDYEYLVRKNDVEDDSLFSLNEQKVKEKVNNFQKSWNEEKVPLLMVDVVEAEDKEVIFRIYHEYSNNKRYKYFEFREDEEKNKVIEDLEVTSKKYEPVTKKTVKIDLDREESIGLIFGTNPEQWTRILEGILEHLFGEGTGKEDLELPAYEEAEEIQDVYEETIEQDKSWEHIKDSVENRKSAAKSEVEKSDLRDAEKKQIKENLDKIGLAGNSLEDEPELGVIAQTLVADLETFTTSVPGGEQMFEHIMKKADSSNFSLKLRLEDKEVTMEGNDFNPETPLTEVEDRALRFFMGDRKDE